ncbi:MAG: Crp/Fnr family transcriptional regulator [Pseudomonadota bacterium]
MRKLSHLQKDDLGLDVTRADDGKTDILRKSAVFSDLNKQQCLRLSRLGVEHHVKLGQFMYSEADLLEYFYVVAEGRLKILKHSPSGKDVIVAFSGPGEILGNVSLSSEKPHFYSAQAVLDTKVLAIKSDDLRTFLSNDLQVGFEVLRKMLLVADQRLTSALRRLVDLAAERAEHRLAYTLFTLSSEVGCTLPFTRQEVAQMAGTTTETAIRFVSRLKKAGVVRAPRRKIHIIDQAKLGLLFGDLPQA